MTKMMTITKTEVTSTSIRITLENGVVVDMSMWSNHLHLHFSGLDIDAQPALLATPFNGVEGIPTLPLANYVDLTYVPRKKD